MDYIKALDEERKKILVFEKELPLSLQLVTQAIETCKQQQQIASNSEEICSELGPVLEEFIPLRPSYSSSSDEENSNNNNYNKSNDLNGTDKKPDWLRSVQLWNQQPEPEGDVLRKPIAVSAKRIGGAFRPFEREKVSNVHESSSTENNTTVNANRGGGGGGGGGSGEEKEKEGHSHRKARRCWSPELHHRFLHALQQLGGSHAATPKQIRELMKVDGLTNDEVKSHLQKYRLHTRRPANRSVKSNSSGTPQQPQIVLVSGIWVPPPAYTIEEKQKTDSKGDHTNAVYAPVASLPLELGSKRCNGDISSKEDGERTNSDSSSTSSSSQTTVSPPF